MKKLFAYSLFACVVLASCTGTQQLSSSYTDDVYANPAQERIEQERIAAERKKQQDAYEKRYNDSLAAIAEKEKNNPYYKDPQYNSDDYYDYEYASRLRRFDNSVQGLGYYDNYYTNSYWYSGNPYQYGTSIYSGYSFWPSYNTYNYMPSTYFYNSMGWGSSFGFGVGYGNAFGNPYGYGGGFGNPYGGFGYNSYMQGYYNGYNHGYNNGWWGYPYGGYGSPYGYGYGGYGSPYGYGGGWGYYNGYDVNSGYTYAPRTSHSGSSNQRMSNPGMSTSDPYYSNYVQKMATQQDNTPKFQEVKAVEVVSPGYSNNPGNNGNGTGKTGSQPARNNNNGYYNNGGSSNQPVYSEPVRNNQPVRYNNAPVKNTMPDNNTNVPTNTAPTRPDRWQAQPANQQPVQQQQQQPIRYEQPARNSFEMPSNNNYNSAPRNGGSPGGGGGRPR